MLTQTEAVRRDPRREKKSIYWRAQRLWRGRFLARTGKPCFTCRSKQLRPSLRWVLQKPSLHSSQKYDVLRCPPSTDLHHSHCRRPWLREDAQVCVSASAPCGLSSFGSALGGGQLLARSPRPFGAARTSSPARQAAKEPAAPLAAVAALAALAAPCPLFPARSSSARVIRSRIFAYWYFNTNRDHVSMYWQHVIGNLGEFY